MQSYFEKEIDIKQFKKGKRINKGGFGVVYEAKNIKTGQLYAAKIIDCDDDEEQCRKMINREISIMLTTNHPTIVKLIGYSLTDFHDEHNITIIMDLARNGSLKSVIKSNQEGVGPKEYDNTARQIILIGISRSIKYLHGGTLIYMAPEIIEGQNYDRKADIYSFGIIMYEIVTDLSPYPSLDRGDINDFNFKKKVVNNSLRPVFKFPVKKEIKELIEQCWANDPSDRPSIKNTHF